MEELAGKVAVVTGAASGIGRALIRRFADEDMRVVLADVDEASLGAAVESLRASGVGDDRILARTVDVRDEAQVHELADAAFATFGQVDVLCNNAGVFVGGLIWERPAADFEFVLGVNVWGILHGIRAFVPRMIAQGTPGHIVDTCSINGLLGAPYSGPYVVSKFAAFAITETLAADLASIGSPLRVTALCPGPVATGIADSERHRPTGLATDTTPDRELVEQILAEVVGDGIDPAAVADLVVDAIHEERFLVFTHPQHPGEMVVRAEALASGRLPELGRIV